MILLFDVDGTLTDPICKISDEMLNTLRSLKNKNYTLGIVGGSNIEKIKNQIGDDIYKLFDYVFVENGLVFYKNGELINKENIIKKLGETNLQVLMNEILYQLSLLNIPKKRSNFIELRNACINISPIGRNCSYDERIEFYEYDKKFKVREKLLEKLNPSLKLLNMEGSIGGMISIDVYCKGWDKSYCLNFLSDQDNIHFFGDKCTPLGNDYPLYSNKLVKGHEVKNYHDTIQILNKYFL